MAGVASDRICEWVARKASHAMDPFANLQDLPPPAADGVGSASASTSNAIVVARSSRIQKASTQESIIICRSLKPKPSSSLWLASDHLTLVSSAIFPPGSRSYEISCCFCQTIGSTSRCKTATLPSLCCPESDGAEPAASKSGTTLLGYRMLHGAIRNLLPAAKTSKITSPLLRARALPCESTVTRHMTARRPRKSRRRARDQTSSPASRPLCNSQIRSCRCRLETHPCRCQRG